MKRRFIVFLGMLIIIIPTGCSNPLNNENKKINFDKDNYQNFKCDVLNDVSIVEMNYFLTKYGDLYYYDLGNYKNGQNCVEVNNANKIKFKYGDMWVGVDKNIYQTNNKKEIQQFNLKNYPVPEDVLAADDILKYDHNLILKKDGIIYNADSLEIYKSFDNEKILDYKYESKKIIYLKTDKAYYINTITNEEECRKYSDAKCKYKLKRNDFLTKHYNEIAFIDDYSIDSGRITYITKNGKIYSIDLEGNTHTLGEP